MTKSYYGRSKIRHPNKTTQTNNKWTPELRQALHRSVEKGLTLDEICSASKRYGLPFTRCAIGSQIRGMGYSIIKGIIVPKIHRKSPQPRTNIISLDDGETYYE